MPRKISIVKKRKWLEQFEDGKQIVSIAKKNNKDTRTINKGIEDARRERDATLALAGMLEKALKNHHENLLANVRDTMPYLTPAPFNLDIPFISKVPLTTNEPVVEVPHLQVSRFTLTLEPLLIVSLKTVLR